MDLHGRIVTGNWRILSWYLDGSSAPVDEGSIPRFRGAWKHVDKRGGLAWSANLMFPSVHLLIIWMSRKIRWPRIVTVTISMVVSFWFSTSCQGHGMFRNCLMLLLYAFFSSCNISRVAFRPISHDIQKTYRCCLVLWLLWTLVFELDEWWWVPSS